MVKGKNLKTALQSQQSRFKLKEKEKALQAAQSAEQRSKKNAQKHKRRSKDVSSSRPPTIPFRPTDKILLIGEGNFSFARALIRDPPAEIEGLPPSNVTATSYDSEDRCYKKYPDAKEIVQSIRELGVEVLFNIDATRLDKASKLKGRSWDKIVWNFPHAGKGITDQDRNILSNQVLILGFLRSSAGLLAKGSAPSFTNAKNRKAVDDDSDDDGEGHSMEYEGRHRIPDAGPTQGTILITLRNVTPYTLWDVPRLAKNPPEPSSGSTPLNPRYTLLRSFRFHRNAWKGYEHRMTKGERAAGTGTTGEGGEDRTWEFFLSD